MLVAVVGSMAVMLVFSVGTAPFADAVSSESVAIQVIATLVGSMGLIAAVPLTTLVAALLAVRLVPDRVGDVHEGHAH